MSYELLFLLLIIMLFMVLGVAVWRMRKSGTESYLGDSLAKISEHQSQLSGRFQEFSMQNQQNMEKLREKITQQEKQMADRLHQQASQGHIVMGDLKERLAKILTAQEKIDSLSESVIDLKQILDNKQRRGLYGEIRLMDIIKENLPPSAYDFQQKLRNGKIADCLLKLPGQACHLVIDAKFPLEDYRTLAESRTEAQITHHRKAFANAVLKHVKDIAEKYLIPGETADIAVMFVPSETIYSEIYSQLPDLVDKACNMRVYFTSPTTLMALLSTIQAVLKDADMRQEAIKIRSEVIKIGEDINRLGKRVDKLAQSYQHMGSSIDDIQISTRKISQRAEKFEALDIRQIPSNALDAEPPPAALPFSGEGADE